MSGRDPNARGLGFRISTGGRLGHDGQIETAVHALEGANVGGVLCPVQHARAFRIGGGESA